jgi:hypothetical protein
MKLKTTAFMFGIIVFCAGTIFGMLLGKLKCEKWAGDHCIAAHNARE